MWKVLTADLLHLSIHSSIIHSSIIHHLFIHSFTLLPSIHPSIPLSIPPSSILQMCIKLTNKFSPLVTDKEVHVFPDSAGYLGSQSQWSSDHAPFCLESGVVGCIKPSEKVCA
jgi:hypothetical protein